MMKINPFAIMGNGPMAMLMRAAQGGGDPMKIIGQMAGNDPHMRQGMNLIQGKTPQQLEQMARNMAQERGVDVRQMLSNMGIDI